MYCRARAPLRISFIGGGTDLPCYYEQFGGAVLSSTINHYARVTARPQDNGRVSLFSIDFGTSVNYNIDEKPYFDDSLKLAIASVQRIHNHGKSIPGVELTIESDAPAGGGLGGSAALTVSVIGALQQLLGIHLNKYAIAETACAVERTDMKFSGGKQDQYESTFGGFNLIEFNAKRIVVTPLRLDVGALCDLEHHCLLCYTGKTHTSGKIIDDLEKYIKEGRPETIAGLAETYHLVYEMEDALLLGNLSRFAEILDYAWKLKVKINPPQVTNPMINEMYEIAKANGAIGGKLLGAGAGGYILLFCHGNSKRRVREKLEKTGAQFMEFSFVTEGLQSWRSDCA